MLMILIIVLIGFMLFSSWRNAKKQNAKRDQMFNNDLVAGVWVMTQSGYYGRYVETDGDVIVLENSDGTETLWSKRAIALVQDPPFAVDTQEEEAPETLAEAAEETVNSQEAQAQTADQKAVDADQSEGDTESAQAVNEK